MNDDLLLTGKASLRGDPHLTRHRKSINASMYKFSKDSQNVGWTFDGIPSYH